MIESSLCAKGETSGDGCGLSVRARPAWHGVARGFRVDPLRRISDLRHTHATMSLAAGVSLFSLARRMGTSVELIDRTYGHLASDAEDYERALLDAYDAKTEAFWQGTATGAATSVSRAHRIPANRGKPTPGLEPGTPSLR